MKKLRVLCDVDGVIADYRKAFLKEVKGILPDFKVPKNAEPDWDVAKEFQLSPALAEMVYEKMTAPGVAQHIDELPDAVDGVKELAKFADVYFVTSPTKTSKTWEFDRRTWLVNKFGEEQGMKIVSTHHKYLVEGDVFIDDKPEHLREWLKRHQLGVAVGFGPTARAGQLKSDAYISTATWAQVLRFVKQLSELGN